MDVGSSCFGEVAFGTVLAPLGVTIIPEVALLTRELVLVFEVDLIQPHASDEME